MDLLFYIKYMQIVNITDEKPLRATCGKNVTATDGIASGLTICVGDIAMHGSARLTDDTADTRDNRCISPLRMAKYFCTENFLNLKRL